MVGARAVARTTLVVVGVLAGLLVLYRLREVVGLVVVAGFIAVALAPAVDPLVRRGVPRALAIALAYLAILGGLFGLVLVLAPPVVDEVEQFGRQAPGYVTDIRDSESLRRYDNRYGITDRLGEQANRLPRALDDAAGELESVTVGVFKRMFELITVLTMAFFLLLDAPRITGFLFGRLRLGDEQRARALAADASRAVGGYVAGSAAIAALAGLVSFAAMTVLGLPVSVPLAVLMAFCALIPLVGSAIGAAPIALVAALHSFPEALLAWVAFFVVYQQAESRLLGPFVYRRTVDLHPLLAIVAVLAGASLLGILGALLAIPVAAIVQILVKDWWRLRGPRSSPETAAEPA